MQHYIDIINDDNGWKVISENLINEIIENSILYNFTFHNNDIKDIIYSIRENLFYKNIYLLDNDKKLIKNDIKQFNKLIDKINKEIKILLNIPININEFIDYKEGYFTVIKYKYNYESK